MSYFQQSQRPSSKLPRRMQDALALGSDTHKPQRSMSQHLTPAHRSLVELLARIAYRRLKESQGG